MRETPYDTEDVLQRLIERHPEILAGRDEDHSRLVLVRREAGIADQQDAGARWSLDHVYLDAAGVPTLVEVKRSSDTRSRREVVAQMLDYAAHARFSFSSEQMAAWLDEAARRANRTVGEMLSETIDVEDVDEFWQSVDANLQAERFRLVFVSDSIGPELRRIIEFLNGQMTRTEVLALEVKQYTDADGEHQTIVPRVVGDTSDARTTKRSAGAARLDRESLLEQLRAHDPRAAEAATGLLDWAEGAASVRVKYATGSAGVWAREGTILRLWRDGWLEVGLRTLEEHGPPWDASRREQLVAELAELGIRLTAARQWPRAPLVPLADGARLRAFVSVVERVLASLS